MESENLGQTEQYTSLTVYAAVSTHEGFDPDSLRENVAGFRVGVSSWCRQQQIQALKRESRGKHVKRLAVFARDVVSW
jgi:hypothetical protein